MFSSPNFLLRVFTPSLIASAVLHHSAFAQNENNLQLEEIIVTAQKRVQSLQDVPLSISAVTGDKMASAGLTNLENIASYVPNFSVNQTGISTTVTIRGISSGINQGFEQSVGMYIDGVYYGRAQLARAPMLDVERVEVLRGPQGILFGKNTIGGAVSTVTAKPTDEFEGSVRALYEPDHGEEDLRLVLSGPFSDSVAGRLAILDRRMDGFMHNTVLDKDEPDLEERVLRGTLRWEPNDTLSATLKVESGSFDVNGRNIEVIGDTAAETGFGLSTIYTALSGGTALDAEQDFRRQANGDTSENDTENVTLTIDFELGDNTLTSVTGYNAYEYDENCDCEYTGLNTFTLELDEEFDQVSQELRLVSPVGERVEYIAGVFYQRADLRFEDAFRVPETSALVGLSDSLAGYVSQRDFQQDSDLWAVFAQFTLNLSDSFRVTLGGRYTDEEKEASRDFFSTTTGPNMEIPGLGGVTQLDLAENVLRAEPHFVSDSRSETAFTPLINLQFDVTDSAMLYFTATTGFKAGGFDVRSNASPDPGVGVPAAVTEALGQPPSPVGVFEFEEEEATSFEVGAKMTLAGGAAELNIALYDTDYDDLQVSIFDGGLGFNVGNAAEASTRGLEMDGRWRASQNLSVLASLAYLDFEFEDYKNGECYFRQEVLEPERVTNAALDLCSFDGRRQAYTPEWTGTFTLDYARAVGNGLEIRAVTDFIYYDDYLASPSLDPRLRQEAYWKVNARLALGAEDRRWELALLGKNLTDEAILTYGAEVPASSTLVEGATGGQPGLAYYGFYERPYSLALQGTFRF